MSKMKLQMRISSMFQNTDITRTFQQFELIPFYIRFDEIKIQINHSINTVAAKRNIHKVDQHF
ncbi:MAG: hypothetical protein A3F71_23935 [Burkholderiales bacterium RIFCSPLOWO2_12_FULL_64_33]|nr:MAG: hypothetical protein A3C40_00745 [Burkholderiales bacterium RIFCSPHIGHO2_02_FULL_64_19]OGB58719.1 MAG: hypothetical protein A3F71_23935 [Burkholderiales bacterium RIFCSPLOWO2_12_FULL_64_33]